MGACGHWRWGQEVLKAGFVPHGGKGEQGRSHDTTRYGSGATEPLARVSQTSREMFCGKKVLVDVGDGSILHIDACDSELPWSRWKVVEKVTAMRTCRQRLYVVLYQPEERIIGAWISSQHDNSFPTSIYVGLIRHSSWLRKHIFITPRFLFAQPILPVQHLQPP